MLTSLLLSGLALAAARPSHHPLEEDGRGLSAWTGWGPGSGMAMFASSSADQDPWAVPPVWKLGQDDTPRPLERNVPQHKKEPKKKHRHQEDEDDDYSDESGGSRANASFNAWFPILLGGYPGREEGDTRSRQGNPGEPGVAAVANSVNHAKSGVANSHAIVYSGEPGFPQALRRRNNFYR